MFKKIKKTLIIPPPKVVFTLLKKDKSLQSLFIANLLTFFWVIFYNTTLKEVVFIFYFQSIIIGFFTVIKILGYPERNLSTMLKSTSLSLKTVKKFIALFFCAHFGFFFLGYLFFLGLPDTQTLKIIFVPILFFFINHFFSYLKNREIEYAKKDILEIMFSPYPRVFAIQFFVIFSGFIGAGMIVLFVVKTYADLAMHISQYESDNLTLPAQKDNLLPEKQV